MSIARALRLDTVRGMLGAGRVYRSMIAAFLALALALLASGCGRRRPPSIEPAVDALACRQEGLASWYGRKFHGRPTASGERFDMRAMTAAHRSLPFGTPVRVVHLASGRSIEVRINDRGPFVAGRIVDLSRAAATALGMKEQGIARVLLIRLDRECR